jgi:hypothetical protein
MPRKKKSIRDLKRNRDLKKEAHERYQRYIAAELDKAPDVGTESLALGFYNQEQPLLKKIANATLINILVKWADDILNQSIAKEAARDGHAQMVLPMSLQGIEVPGAYSFINGANQKRFVAAYKAELFHLESHAYILRKFEDDVRTSREEHDRLVKTVKPVMEAGVKTLGDALQYLRDHEAGAA